VTAIVGRDGPREDHGPTTPVWFSLEGRPPVLLPILPPRTRRRWTGAPRPSLSRPSCLMNPEKHLPTGFQASKTLVGRGDLRRIGTRRGARLGPPDQAGTGSDQVHRQRSRPTGCVIIPSTRRRVAVEMGRPSAVATSGVPDASPKQRGPGRGGRGTEAGKESHRVSRMAKGQGIAGGSVGGLTAALGARGTPAVKYRVFERFTRTAIGRAPGGRGCRPRNTTREYMLHAGAGFPGPRTFWLVHRGGIGS